METIEPEDFLLDIQEWELDSPQASHFLDAMEIMAKIKEQNEGLFLTAKHKFGHELSDLMLIVAYYIKSEGDLLSPRAIKHVNKSLTELVGAGIVNVDHRPLTFWEKIKNLFK